MEKNLSIEFNYKSKSVRTLKIKNEVWFVAKDVCEILEIQNTSQAVENLDDDEKLIYVLHIAGQKREALIINQSGLYALILRSNKPEAKKFRKWITGEVIPALMNEGTYTINTRNYQPVKSFLVRDIVGFRLDDELRIKVLDIAKQYNISIEGCEVKGFINKLLDLLSKLKMYDTLLTVKPITDKGNYVDLQFLKFEIRKHSKVIEAVPDRFIPSEYLFAVKSVVDRMCYVLNGL